MQPGTTLRTALPEDAEALSDLAMRSYCDAFGHSFRTSDLLAHLSAHLSPRSFARILSEDVVLVAEVDGRMVGYVQFGIAPAPAGGLAVTKALQVRRFFVAADAQHQGIGALLMDAVLGHPQVRDAKSVYLEVWERNQVAQKFCARYGFEVVGRRPLLVASGAPTGAELVMVRHASSA
jgi:diamine N-acetyltransferase